MSTACNSREVEPLVEAPIKAEQQQDDKKESEKQLEDESNSLSSPEDEEGSQKTAGQPENENDDKISDVTTPSDETSQTLETSESEDDMQTPVVQNQDATQQDTSQSETSSTGNTKEIVELTDEEEQDYLNKYIKPYGGLLYSSWSNITELPVDSLIKFYLYNDFDSYMSKQDPEQLQGQTEISIPSDTVDSFISRYFKVDKEYLHQADNYDSSTNSYIFSLEQGFGDSPLSIIKIEKNEKENIWKFICADVNNDELSVTVEIVDEEHFYYISSN